MKPNAMLRRLELQAEVKYRAKFDANVKMLLQLCCDAAFFAANRVLHMGPTRTPRFRDAIEQEINWIFGIMYDDQKDDPDFEYAKAKIDERMQKIRGEHFQPWEGRYGK